MLMLKPCIQPETILALMAADRVFEKTGYDPVVTACIDRKHSTTPVPPWIPRPATSGVET
jgi:hypothetical protein